MATHALGKLKFNLSSKGLAYRWGDGEIKRLFGRKAKPDDEAYNEEYSEYDADEGYADPGYADDNADYADDPGYADDDYRDDEEYYDDDPGYDDDGYDDDDPGYDDGGDYEDDGYGDDPGYDDGYDDDAPYDDDGYDDGGEPYDDDGYDDEGYDDRYSDEDADGYDDGYYQNQSPLMQYVDENDWVTYLLLFLFPPLGIYLLWRRNRFEKPIRYAITAASAIWFIVALILIFSGIFGGTNDESQQPSIALVPSATVSALDLDGSDTTGTADGVSDLKNGITASEPSTDTSGTSGTSDSTGTSSGSTSGGSTGSDVAAAPSPTPLNDGTAASAALKASDYVYSPATGLYYHSKSDCKNIDEGVSVSRVPKDVAENNRKQSACPVCIGAAAGGDSTTYYATRGGSYYHIEQNCSGMTGAVPYTKEAAERAGKTECPVCILHTQVSVASGAVKFVSESTEDKSNIFVYSTSGGKYYHMTSDCSGMTGASRGSLKDALLAGKNACPTCCSAAGTAVYCTNGGKYYHQDRTCSGMTGAAEVTLAEAMVLGKSKCPDCIKGNLPTASEIAKKADAASDEVMVYGTPNGQYYHTEPTCSGMTNAQRYSLKSMLQQKRAACPVCASASDTVVYATEGGEYYHSYATCSGMTNATSGTMAQALAYGYKRCPRCWNSSGSANTTSASASGGTNKAASSATAGNTYVYATKAGSYYHLNSGCSGMKGASRITLKQAINAGKKACPTCASSANRVVYSTDSGDHYHAASVCSRSGMKNGKKRTLSQALMLNQTACQYCMRGGSSSATTADLKASQAQKAAAQKAAAKKEAVSKAKAAAAKLTNTHTYSSGKSGIKVYATPSGAYYHRNRTCSGMKNAVRLTLESAMNYGKRACPTCASAARRTVYATRGGKYYHYSRIHAGVGSKSGSLASALGYGYKACPYCVTKTKSLTRRRSVFRSGTSGIKVYATASGAYYHSRRTCSGMTSPSRITLETALNYGKKACPTCMSVASKKVYSSLSDSYYHLYRAHAGSGASAGTLARAKAMGKKLCPQCARGISTGISTRGSISYKNAKSSTVNYSAPSTTKVYVDLEGKNYFYYHKSSRCSDMGMSGGTKITLQYAKDWGYKACPYCNPPTSVA